MLADVLIWLPLLKLPELPIFAWPKYSTDSDSFGRHNFSTHSWLHLSSSGSLLLAGVAQHQMYNKLRNLSLSHRKIHPKFLNRARLNRHCYDYHDLDRFSDWRMATVASRSPGDFLRLSSIRQRQSFSRPLFSTTFPSFLSFFSSTSISPPGNLWGAGRASARCDQDLFDVNSDNPSVSFKMFYFKTQAFGESRVGRGERRREVRRWKFSKKNGWIASTHICHTEWIFFFPKL